MRNAINVVAALFISILCGCTTPQYNYRPDVQQISRPALNSINVANVGDEMLSQGMYVEREAIKLAHEIKFGGLFTAYRLSPGFYIKTGEDRVSSYYKPAVGRECGEVTKAALVDPWESIRMTKDGKTISVVTVFHLKVNEKADGVSMTTYPILTDDSFQQTLIYSGKVGDKIKIGYREFSNNAARPAFNNDVDYDISQSSVIGYKGARLEVIEATNELIRYKVITNFNIATR